MHPDSRPSPVPDSVPRLLCRPVPILIALCCGVELVLIGADQGLVGTPRWRGLAYQYGAFWAGLLSDWRPNYAAQPWTMFLTYSFLHAGLGHLAGNMLTLLALGPFLNGRWGRGGFLLVYFLSAVGGAGCFALLGTSVQPVVGASGALFGLAGALVQGDWAARRRTGRSPWPVLRAILFLVALNVVFWIALDGLLAWETHLGGFVAGWAVAVGLAWVGPARTGGEL